MSSDSPDRVTGSCRAVSPQFAGGLRRVCGGFAVRLLAVFGRFAGSFARVLRATGDVDASGADRQEHAVTTCYCSGYQTGKGNGVGVPKSRPRFPTYPPKNFFAQNFKGNTAQQQSTISDFLIAKPVTSSDAPPLSGDAGLNTNLNSSMCFRVDMTMPITVHNSEFLRDCTGFPETEGYSHSDGSESVGSRVLTEMLSQCSFVRM